MAIYRFRVSLEDNEDIYRDIDIRATQTFEEFHLCIQTAFKFDAKHAASFFVSDDYWRKGDEVTLRKEDLELDEEEKRTNVTPKRLMSSVKISKLIEQPHQRFIYVFDPNVQWSFLIEMVKIAGEDAKLNYPACVRTVGTAPRQYKQTNMAKEELSPDLAMAGMLNDPEIDDSEIYKSLGGEEGVEDEDLESLEGEEGEEKDEEDENEFEGDDDDDNYGGYGDSSDEN
jgi:hypothetical protein